MMVSQAGRCVIIVTRYYNRVITREIKAKILNHYCPFRPFHFAIIYKWNEMNEMNEMEIVSSQSLTQQFQYHD